MKSERECKEYGISKDDVITLERLMSIILYTDYTELSRKFTATLGCPVCLNHCKPEGIGTEIIAGWENY